MAVSSTNDFVNRIVEATDAGEWSQAIDVWNEMTEKRMEKPKRRTNVWETSL